MNTYLAGVIAVGVVAAFYFQSQRTRRTRGTWSDNDATQFFGSVFLGSVVGLMWPVVAALCFCWLATAFCAEFVREFKIAYKQAVEKRQREKTLDD